RDGNIAGEMRLYLAQEPFQPDAVRVPCPCADEGKVVSCRAWLSRLHSARRDERHRREPVGSKSKRRAVIFGKGEDETRRSAEAAFQPFENARLAGEQEFLNEASGVGGVFLRRAIFHIMRHEERRLVLENIFK